jgi:hypothetical protein
VPFSWMKVLVLKTKCWRSICAEPHCIARE